MNRYVVSVYDQAGEFSTTSCTDFAHLLGVVEIMTRAYPGKVVRAFNLDRNDYDTDGLTEEESEAVDEAAYAASMEVRT